MLKLQLLGGFKLTRDEEMVETIDTARLQSLFSLLALNKGNPMPRPSIAFEFWPDTSESQSLTNLRNLLHGLRKALPESKEFLAADKKSLLWSKEGLTIDYDDFNESITQSKTAEDPADRIEHLTSAVTLYEGPLLPSCYDDWIQKKREEAQKSYLAALRSLISIHSDRSDFDQAIAICGKLIRCEPENEPNYRTLMELYLNNGDRSSALNVYRKCVTVLQREFNIGPSRMTRDLHLRLLSDDQNDGGSTKKKTRAIEKPEFPLQGRESELLVLGRCWSQSVQGKAQIALVIGEAGVGKSRLVEELYTNATIQGHIVSKTRSYAAEGSLAYAPVAQWLATEELYENFSLIDSVWLNAVSQVLPQLRNSFPNSLSNDPSAVSSQRHLFEGLSRSVTASKRPILLVIDDLQWTDLETLQWMRHLLRFAPTSRILILGTIREEELTRSANLLQFMSEVSRDDQLMELRLGRLNEELSAKVASDVAGYTIPQSDAAQLFLETEGNPLFIVESVLANKASHSVKTSSQASTLIKSPMPPRVRAIFIARLTKLSNLPREIVSVAAVLGRAFSPKLVKLILQCSEDELIDALESLWHSRIVREQGNGQYDFSHDKLREVAYGELSPPRRRSLHSKAAKALRERHRSGTERVHGRIATHLENAGETEEAIEEFFKAGEMARSLNANAEAIRLFKRSIELINGLPVSTAVLEQELKVQLALGVSYSLVDGFSELVIDGYSRAEEICLDLGRPVETPILRALAIGHVNRGQMRLSYPLGKRIMKMAEESNDGYLYQEAQYTMGVSCFWLGKFEESFERLEKGAHRSVPKRSVDHASLYSLDPQAVCLSRSGWAAWYLGRPTTAVAAVEKSITYAGELGHPFTLAYVLSIAGSLYTDCRKYGAAAEALEQLGELSKKYDFKHWSSQVPLRTAYIEAATNKVQQGVLGMENNMIRYTELGNLVNCTQFFTMLSQAYIWKGDFVRASSSLEKAFTLTEEVDERFYLAEMYRIKGEISLNEKTGSVHAETCFRNAMEIARNQKSLTLELRAAASLARLWHDSGHSEKALVTLKRCYEAFPEKVPVQDVAETESLLQHLSCP